MEFLHVTFELPWWTSIAVCKSLNRLFSAVKYVLKNTHFPTGVVIARMLLFPLVIKNQRNTIHMHNVTPGMQELQTKMEKARMHGNNMESKISLF